MRAGAGPAWLLPAAALLVLSSVARAADPRPPAVQIRNAWARPTPPALRVGVVYFTVANGGDRADRLVAIDSPVAASAELHESRNVGGVMQMRPVTALECPPHAEITSKAGGLHVMLMGLTQPLVAGKTFTMTFRFRDAGPLTTPVTVEQRE